MSGPPPDDAREGEAGTAPVVADGEAPRDDAGRSEAAGHAGWGTQAVMFCGIGAFMALIGIVYWFVSYEWMGTVLLGLTASMAIGSGLYLGWPRADLDEDPGGEGSGEQLEPGHDPHDGIWFPEASVWPFAIGAAMVLFANGLLLGRWLVVPAAVFLAWSIAGMIRQGRRRV